MNVVSYTSESHAKSAITLMRHRSPIPAIRLILFFVCVGISASAGDLIFSSSPAVGFGPFTVLTIDANGDGKPDLVSVNAYDSTLTVLTNSGNGTFTLDVKLATASTPVSVVSADINGDGKPDLMTVNEASPGTISVFTNAGRGLFTLSATLVIGGVPDAITASDVDGDGAPDLIFADYALNKITVMLNNGSGSFGGGIGYPVGHEPDALVAVDVNGDGKPDLVSANHEDPGYSPGTLTLLTNNGNGTFQLSATIRVGDGPHALITADVNNDGKPDLISANYEGGSFTVLTNNGSGGFSISAQPPLPYSSGVAVGNLNGDNLPDLAVLSYLARSVTIFTNAGHGILIPSETANVGADPEGLVATCVKGYGKDDLVSANTGDSSLTVLLNSPVMPSLTIERTLLNAALVSWSDAIPGFILQKSPTVPGTNWLNVTNSAATVSGVKEVIVDTFETNAFYRLFHP